ncbi:MAG: divergent polysaccharide deacetylase family protein [Xanthobacteraceae bacterium]
MADDLTAPLGGPPKKKRRAALPPFVPQAVAGVLGLSLGVFLLWAATAEDPFGGEPMAVVFVDPGMIKPANVAEDAQASVQPDMPSRYDGPEPSSGPAAGSQTVTIIDGTSGKRQDVMIPGDPAQASPRDPKDVAGGKAPAAPNPRLLENSRHGSIPKIAPDGKRPSEVYARPAKLAAGRAEGPQIAIVVGGLGIGASGTAEALAKLPAPVTFAVAPYGADLGRLTERARAGGHEVLLQVPMEPFDYPDNDPGPQTLLTTLDSGQNMDRLYWLMSRFQGYVGIANYMGARFTASEPALGPVLRETAKRGLIYLDDGASPRSLASQLAGANNLPFAKGDLVIDAVPTSVEIDRALARLESIARQNGVAVGVASALPASIDRIAQWTKAVESRGFVLVPISAVANKAKSS